MMLRTLSFLVLVVRSDTAPCSVCANGEDITLPKKQISVPGYEFIKDCATLDSLVPALLQDDDVVCQVIQDVSTLCGCPRKSGTCNLCADGSKVSNPGLDVPLIFQDQFQGIVPTCELFEAYLHNVDETNSTCTLAQQVLSDYCGCKSEDDSTMADHCSLCVGGENITQPNKTLGIEGFPVQDCQELFDTARIFLREGSETCNLLQSVGTFCGCPAPIQNSCTLCRDGSVATNQSRSLPFLEEQFGFTPTCGIAEAALATELADSESCTSAQYFGTTCGCPPIENHCYLCDPGDVPSTPNKEIPQLEKYVSLPFAPTCAEFNTFQYQIEAETDLCALGYDQRWRCGCNGGHWSYLGADTVAKQAALAWIPRVTGAISICVSADFDYFRPPQIQMSDHVACRVLFSSCGIFFLTAKRNLTRHILNLCWRLLLSTSSTALAGRFQRYPSPSTTSLADQ